MRVCHHSFLVPFFLILVFLYGDDSPCLGRDLIVLKKALRVSRTGSPLKWYQPLEFVVPKNATECIPSAAMGQIEPEVLESKCCQGWEHPISSHLREIAALAADVPLLILFAEVGGALGHFNVLGIPPEGWLDLHVDGSKDAVHVLAEVHEFGALFSINHPFRPCCLWKMGAPGGIDSIEVWNGGVGDGLWDASDEKAVAWWDALLAKGLVATAIGGSDCHFTADVKWVGEDYQGRPGRPTTWVLADTLESSSILDGVRAGRS